MYSMPSNYCPSPIRLMPACPMVPSSPMTGVQTFYITMPSDAAAAMFFDPNLAAVQQQHQSLMMQHAAHQSSMSPYRHLQQHHQMLVGNNTNNSDSSMQHHPFQTTPSAFFMAATAPPTSPGGAFFQQQLASPLPFYMRPNGQTISQAQMMPGKMAPSTSTMPVSAPSPLTVITTSTATTSNASSPPPSSTTNATHSSGNDLGSTSDNSNTKRLSPIPCALLEDDTMIKPSRSVTGKAIASLASKLSDLLRACTWSLPIQEELMELVSIEDVSHDILVNATNYLTDVAIFLGLRLIKLMLPVESVADELWNVLWKNRVCYLGADIHQTLIAHTFECFAIKPAYGYGELLDVLIGRLGDRSFDRKLMNRIVRLFLKASCLKKFRETPDDVLVSLSENITNVHEFEMRHNTTIVRLLLIEGFHFEPEEYSELIVGNDSLVDYIKSFIEIWYSNYSLTMCIDDLMVARERAHDPFKLKRFCDEMEAFRLYTEVEAMTPISILNSLQTVVNMLSIVHNEHEWHNRPSTYNPRLTVRAKRTIKKPFGHGNLLLPQYHHQRQNNDFESDFYGDY
ncbi:unnamed protein product [Rotaria socialis]|uniref:Uncharacterized protein n=3 Tax=Rotaria socialis TaxID=392032 RepID=A0A817XAW4_9BILA|nr:unnamed protein product [Rotaria socialis]CAF4496813.1 unnamed protein product [Rotaria socialis]